MAPKLEQVFIARFIAGPDRLPLGPIKGGPHRYVVPFTDGGIEGSGVKAKLIVGTDSPLIDVTVGIGYMDVRAQAKTEEGDIISVHMTGIAKMDEAIQRALEGHPDAKTTRSEDHYWMSAPTFETSSEKLKWLERNVFVGHGHVVVTGETVGIEFEVYKVVSA